MQHELQSPSEELTTPSAPVTAAAAESPSQQLTEDAWWARELIRGQEARRRRQRESLERKLRTAIGFQKFGKWACFATGVVWLVALLAAIIIAEPLIFVIPWMVLPVWALVYLVGSFRRFLVLHAARRHGIELTAWHPILRRWLVAEGATTPVAPPAIFVAPLPGNAHAVSAGAQLDASLARDRHRRQQGERAMQRKLDAACRFEQWGRRDCLWSAYLSVFFWGSLIASPGAELPAGFLRVIMFVSGIGGTIGLVLGTLAVLAGKVRQRLLLKQARAEALEVVRVTDSTETASRQVKASR